MFYIYKYLRSLIIHISIIYNRLLSAMIVNHYCECSGPFKSTGIPVIEKIGDGGDIKIGRKFAMNNGKWGNKIGYYQPCLFKVNKGSITIGDNVGISHTTLCAIGSEITIGNNTLLGSGVKIYTTDFHSVFYNERGCEDLKFAKHGDVIIGEHCFIGSGVIILKGVTIGDKCVIGAGSVVTKSIPQGCLAAGNPCVVLKKIDINNKEHK